MATFLALLSVRHAVLSSNSSALEIALTASPMVFGTVPAAERVRREWAAAVEYLQDPSTVVDMATVAALAPGQRTVLCDLLGAHNSSDAQTAAARIVRMHGGVSAVNLLPTPPSPWRDLLAAAHNSQLPIADAPLEAKILARLAHTPFMAVPSGIALPQLKEIGYCAMWAHDYLIDQAAWDSLTGPLQGELRSHIGFAAALAPDSARDGCIAICNSWRKNATQARPTARPGGATSTPGPHVHPLLSTTSVVAGGIVLPQRVAGTVSVGGVAAWWIVPSTSTAGGSQVDWSDYAQNNIVSPYHLGEPSCMGASVWEPVCTGVHGALVAAVSARLVSMHLRRGQLICRASAGQDLSLKATTKLADLLISGKEAAELKSGRKNETSTRRRITPSLSTYPWCQSFGVGEGMVTGYDAESLGRQLAVALRADGSASVFRHGRSNTSVACLQVSCYLRPVRCRLGGAERAGCFFST